MNRTTLKTLSTLALAAAAALAIPATGFAKEFRSADVHPEDYPTVMAVKYMSDITGAPILAQIHQLGETLRGQSAMD